VTEAENVRLNKPDRRKGLAAIPADLRAHLTAAQIKVLPDLRKKGITVFAIRRPLFQQPVVMVKFTFREGVGVLREDGVVDYFPDIGIRDREGGGYSVQTDIGREFAG
jgi:hypothetical protein